MTDSTEIALREALRASSEIYRQRTHVMDSQTAKDADSDTSVLGAGHTQGDNSFIEPWQARKARRAAAKAAEQPDPKHRVSP
jgi:hypothetical protein